jgi:hypothetical protein
MTQVVEGLPIKWETLNTNLGSTRKRGEKNPQFSGKMVCLL